MKYTGFTGIMHLLLIGLLTVLLVTNEATDPSATSETTTDPSATSETTTDPSATSETTTDPSATSETTTDPSATSETTTDPPPLPETTTGASTTSQTTTGTSTTSQTTTGASTTSQTTTGASATSQTTTGASATSQTTTGISSTSNTQATATTNAAPATSTTSFAMTTSSKDTSSTQSTMSGGTTVTGQSTASMMSHSPYSMTTLHNHNTGSVTGNTTTNHTLSNMTEIYCPSFTCNYSDCYTMFISHNSTLCGPDDYCQLIKEMHMYDVGCSTNCTHSCTNASQTNCSVKCCNFTGCLNDSFASMMQPTTAATTRATTTTTTTTVGVTTTTQQQTTANGNKCYKGTCTDTTCYAAFKKAELQICTSAEKHCQLKMETVDSKVQWTAGCTANCSAQTPCKTSTQPPCHLECCNATATSCLWLNGTLNFPSSATRGPSLNTQLITCFLCLFLISLML